MLKAANIYTFIEKEYYISWSMVMVLHFLLFDSFLIQGAAQDNALHFGPEKDTILIAAEPDYPPFCMINEKGDAVGFSIDLFKAAAEAAGIVPEIKIGIWNQIKQDLADGKLDALPLVGRTPEREPLYEFTMPYISLHGAVFARKNAEDITSLTDLKNQEIIVMKGDNAEEYVRRESVSSKIITTNTYEEAFRLLEDGHHDAVITQRIVGFHVIDQLRLQSVKYIDVPLPGFRQDFCFATKKGDTELISRLNEGLSVIIADDTYEQIRNQWFGPTLEQEIRIREIMRVMLYFLVPFLLTIALIWVLLLRRQVRKRTHRLNEEITHHKKTLSALQSEQAKLVDSEEHIRLLLNSTAEGIFGLDMKGKCIFINNAAIRMLGYESSDALLGQDMHQMIHHSTLEGRERPLEECNLYIAMQQETSTHINNDYFWKSDNTSFPVECFSYPMIKNGKAVGSVVTFRDISEKKKSEKELQRYRETLEAQVAERTHELNDKIAKLNRSQKAMLYMIEDLNTVTAELKNERRKLELSNRELEAFSYSVSHDLRAPLRAINGFSRFLAEDYGPELDEEGRRYINTIRESATKMDMLITDLLSLSRVSRSQLSISEVQIKELIMSVYEEVASDAQKKEFTLETGNMPSIKCDPGLMKQVWQNLIDNALKYSSKSEIKKIIIGVDNDKAASTFFIRDFGAGFDNKYVHKLFGLFQRLHQQDEFEGSGVGLAIVQRIIERHGGTVRAEGSPGKGASFFITLPSGK